MNILEENFHILQLLKDAPEFLNIQIQNKCRGIKLFIKNINSLFFYIKKTPVQPSSYDFLLVDEDQFAKNSSFLTKVFENLKVFYNGFDFRSDDNILYLKYSISEDEFIKSFYKILNILFRPICIYINIKAAAFRYGKAFLSEINFHDGPNIFIMQGDRLIPQNNYNELKIAYNNYFSIIVIEEGSVFVNATIYNGKNDIYIFEKPNARGYRNLILDSGHAGYFRFFNFLKDSSIESLRVAAANESCLCFSLGEDCMLSSNIQIRCTDGHRIYDENNNVINKGFDVEIGNHVWIGASASILKNVKIANNCVIGAYSVIPKSFTEEKCVIAGNPGRVVRRNVNWKREYI